MILYFDVYIISWQTYQNSIKKKDFDINVEKSSIYRQKNNNYKFKSKLEITKYTLLSYSEINWSQIFIRFECEDKNDEEDFKNFCKKNFSNAIIENCRSDTAEKFYLSLSRLKKYKNPWVWFCPNNDHPFLADPQELIELIKVANYYEQKYGTDTSIIYSHFSESMNNFNFFHFLYRDYYLNSYKKIEDKNNHILTLSERFSIDSVKILRLNLLLEIFKNTNPDKRTIRLEDTSYYMSNRRLLTVTSKKELCRHYDSYSFAAKVPPLFIPEGFFEGKIKIFYGYDSYKKNYTNINPNLSFKDIINSKTDLITRYEKIPFFWKKRIKIFDKNPEFVLKNKNFDHEFAYLKNPFLDKYKTSYLLINIYRFIFSHLKKIFNRIQF